jgi:hypothetical protein
MRMKDDRLLAAYNVMIGTNKQMIINYSIHQSAGETHLFSKHIDKLIKVTSDKPDAVIGDSTFGSEENYTYLQEKEIENYLKYPSFHSEQSKTKPGFIYDPDNDTFTCADGRVLKYFEPRKTKNVNGFESTAKAYKPETCDGCLLADNCKKGLIRTLQRNDNLEHFKAQARDNLNSEKGIKLRKQRCIDVESVFGDIKENYGFRRFMLRGLEKVNVEFGLISIAHNLRKVYNKR